MENRHRQWRILKIEKKGISITIYIIQLIFILDAKSFAFVIIGANNLNSRNNSYSSNIIKLFLNRSFQFGTPYL